MTKPRVYDFAIIKYSNGATPAVFTTLCGITNVQVNETVETTDRRLRDCAKPNRPGVREVKVVGIDWTVTGSGATNGDIRTAVKANLLAKHVDYLIEYYEDNNTDAGNLVGTDAGNGLMTANNISVDADGDSTWEITIEGSGELTYTAAPGS